MITKCQVVMKKWDSLVHNVSIFLEITLRRRMFTLGLLNVFQDQGCILFVYAVETTEGNFQRYGINFQENNLTCKHGAMVDR